MTVRGDDVARRKPDSPWPQQEGQRYRFLGDQPYTQPGDPLGYDGLVERLATVVTESRSSTPFVIGIEGPWGIGKSSVMLKLQERLADTGLKTVYYNAWNHEGRRHATEALLKTVLTALDEDILQRWVRFDRNQTLKRWSVWLLRLPVLALAARVGLGNAVDKIWDRLEKSVAVANDFNQRFSDAMREWSERKAAEGQPRLLAVFIDDLDRCSQKSVADILTAVKLYLTVPRCVFIIGYDRMAVDEMIHRRIGMSPVVKGSMYLEKMIQVPFSIPQPNSEAARSCLDQSLGQAGVAPLFAGSEEIIINSTDGNPRKMKRFINVFVLRWLEVEAAGAEPPPDLLALLLLVNLHDRGFSFQIERDFSLIDRFGDYVKVSRAVDQAPTAEYLPQEIRSLIRDKSYFLLRSNEMSRDEIRESLRGAFPASFQGYCRDERLCQLVLAIQEAAIGVPIQAAERVAKASWEAGESAAEPVQREAKRKVEALANDQQLPNSIKEVMEGMPAAFQPDKAAGVDATIQFKFTGDEPGNWTVKIAGRKCTVEEGVTDSATVIINSPSDVILKIVGRELDGATAFMSGQYTFTGDMGVLMQMWSWFGWE
jgi:putative sterol carrier protein